MESCAWEQATDLCVQDETLWVTTPSLICHVSLDQPPPKGRFLGSFVADEPLQTGTLQMKQWQDYKCVYNATHVWHEHHFNDPGLLFLQEQMSSLPLVVIAVIHSYMGKKYQVWSRNPHIHIEFARWGSWYCGSLDQSHSKISVIFWLPCQTQTVLVGRPRKLVSLECMQVFAPSLERWLIFPFLDQSPGLYMMRVQFQKTWTLLGEESLRWNHDKSKLLAVKCTEESIWVMTRDPVRWWFQKPRFSLFCLRVHEHTEMDLLFYKCPIHLGRLRSEARVNFDVQQERTLFWIVSESGASSRVGQFAIPQDMFLKPQ